MSSETTFWQCPRCKVPNPWTSYLTNCLGCGGPRPPAAARVAFIPPKPEPAAQVRRSTSRWLAVSTWTYAALVLVTLLLIKMLGDLWWPATALLFGPRWLFLAPIPLLAGLSIWGKRWRLLIVQGGTLAVVLGPLMGLVVPWSRLVSAPPDGEHLRVMTLNRGSKTLDSKAIVDLLATEKIDILFVQEGRPDPILDRYLATTGWTHDDHHAVFTRLPVLEVYPASDFNAFEEHGNWPVHIHRLRVKTRSGSECIAASVHMPTMSFGFEKILNGDFAGFDRYVAWRWKQTDALIETLQADRTRPVVIGGDFNMPPDSPMMMKITTTYPSAFESSGWGWGYTRPSRFSWIGIDRILTSRQDWKALSARVGPRVGSDHRPLIAEIVLLSSP